MLKKITSFSLGITYIELLFVIAIFAIIGATSIPFVSSFLLKNNYEATRQKLILAIREAQSNSMSNKSNSVWGICKYDDDIRVYTNNCESPGQNRDYAIPSSITLSDFVDTKFSSRGEPSAPFVVSISTNLGSMLVTVNAAGRIDVE